MPNLNLTHSGNMSITSAEITSAGTLNVQYGQNTTGNITGWTHNQSTPLVCGETYTITLIPQFSGTVLTENFVVSGVDEAGVPRSDTSVLRQGFDSNLLHYNPNPRNNPSRMVINSSSATETYLEVNATVVGHSSSSNTVGFYIYHYLPGDPQSKSNFVRFDVVDPTEPDTGGVITSLELVVANNITGTGRASAVYSPSTAFANLVYSTSDSSIATIDQHSGAITVWETGIVTFCVEDQISGLQDCKNVQVFKEGEGYDSLYLTFDIISGGTVYINVDPEQTIYYSKNNRSWVGVTVPANQSPSISVSAGDIVRFKANITKAINFRYTNCVFNVYGNIMSLVYGDSFANKTVLETNYIFHNLFPSVTGLTNAINLSLPATILSNGCYSQMFNGCRNLLTAPELPATALSKWCYQSMFLQCSGLTEAPELPAMYLAEGCYGNMFGQCTSLTSAPALPAVTLAENCYEGMFNRCTSLTSAPVLPAMTMKDLCYSGMFEGCTNLQTPPALPATTLSKGCYSGMFRLCSKLSTPPSLPALTMEDDCYYEMFFYCSGLTYAPALVSTSLADRCYAWMFASCTSLTNAPALPATELTIGCYNSMFYGCVNISTAPDLPAATLVQDCYKQMFRGCSRLSYIKCLASDISASACTENWVRSVAPSGTFVKADGMNAWQIDSNDGIPIGWTSSPDTGDTGTTQVTALTVVINDVVESGDFAYVILQPADAVASIVYSSSDSSIATIDQDTGEITVVGDGTVTICARDLITDISDCKTVTATTSSVGNITSLTINVENIFESGRAYATYSPVTAAKSLVYSSTNPSIATINQTTGEITALDYGYVTFCVRDTLTNLQNCKEVFVSKGGSTSGCTMEVVYQAETSQSHRTRLYNGDVFFTNIELQDGTDITSTVVNNNGYYNFDDSGIKKVYFTLTGGTLEQRFYACPILKVTIPECIMRLGNRCFESCYSLIRVIIPNSVVEFVGTKYGSVEYKMNNNDVSGCTFRSCTSLELVDIPTGLTYLPDWCFDGCSSLTDIILPSGLTSLGQCCFERCSSLSVVSLSDNMLEIPYNCFYECSSLTGITLPSRLQVVRRTAFMKSGLRSLVLPDSVEEIRHHIIYQAYAITSVTFTSLTPPIGSMLSLEVAIIEDDTFPIYIPCQSFNAYYELYSSDRLYCPSIGTLSGDPTSITITCDATIVGEGYITINYSPTNCVPAFHITFVTPQGAEFDYETVPGECPPGTIKLKITVLEPGTGNQISVMSQADSNVRAEAFFNCELAP